MMIDFALTAERREGDRAGQATPSKRVVLRFRPIMMTTMAAAPRRAAARLRMGEGSGVRRPLGIAIVGGLIRTSC